jgi:hypothetical protein
MNRQKGVSLGLVLFWLIVVGMAVMLAAKLIPPLKEYQAVVSSVRAIAEEAGTDESLQDVRKSFYDYSTINDIKSIAPEDLEIKRQGGKYVISFAYSAKIHLFYNVSLVIDFAGSSS